MAGVFAAVCGLGDINGATWSSSRCSRIDTLPGAHIIIYKMKVNGEQCSFNSNENKTSRYTFGRFRNSRTIAVPCCTAPVFDSVSHGGRGGRVGRRLNTVMAWRALILLHCNWLLLNGINARAAIGLRLQWPATKPGPGTDIWMENTSNDWSISDFDFPWRHRFNTVGSVRCNGFSFFDFSFIGEVCPCIFDGEFYRFARVKIGIFLRVWMQNCDKNFWRKSE